LSAGCTGVAAQGVKAGWTRRAAGAHERKIHREAATGASASHSLLRVPQQTMEHSSTKITARGLTMTHHEVRGAQRHPLCYEGAHPEGSIPVRHKVAHTGSYRATRRRQKHSSRSQAGLALGTFQGARCLEHIRLISENLAATRSLTEDSLELDRTPRRGLRSHLAKNA